MSSDSTFTVPIDEKKTKNKSGRPTVTFADDFDPRGLGGSDTTAPSTLLGGNGSPRIRSIATSGRRSLSEDAGANGAFSDDDETPRVTKRLANSTSVLSAPSRAAQSPPYPWHPTGVLYRFTILATVAFILLAGYFSDETIGATNSELRTLSIYDFNIAGRRYNYFSEAVDRFVFYRAQMLYSSVDIGKQTCLPCFKLNLLTPICCPKLRFC